MTNTTLDERLLPDTGEYRIKELWERENGSWYCDLRKRSHHLQGKGGYGPTARAAVLDALENVKRREAVEAEHVKV